MEQGVGRRAGRTGAHRSLGAQQQREELLAGPELHGLDDGGGRQVDLLLVVCRPDRQDRAGRGVNSQGASSR